MTEANVKIQLENYIKQISTLKQQVGKAIVGQDSVIDLLITSLLAGGHCLLEGVPGLGKTRLLRSLGQCLDLQFNRIQFTPDLIPSDIIGSEFIDEHSTEGRIKLKFVRGPVFSQLLLADEINRTPPKTQAALLEAMQELTVTVAGQSYQLERPFMVLATQNPIEQSGTYQLPEAQLDRFLMRIYLDYPSRDDEIAILDSVNLKEPEQLDVVFNSSELVELISLVTDIAVGPSIRSYIIDLARQTRPDFSSLPSVRDGLKWGVSPRACQALVKACQARALINGRLAVIADDIKALIKPVWGHRLVSTLGSYGEPGLADRLLQEIISQNPEPS